MQKCIWQTVDKTNASREFDKSFDQTFSKVCAVEGAQPSSRSAEREIPFLRSLLQAFLLRLLPAREKRLTILCNLTLYTHLVYTLSNAKMHLVLTHFVFA